MQEVHAAVRQIWSVFLARTYLPVNAQYRADYLKRKSKSRIQNAVEKKNKRECDVVEPHRIETVEDSRVPDVGTA